MNIKIKVKNSDYYPKSLKVKWLLATRRLLIRFVLALVIVPFLFWQDSMRNHADKYTHYLALAALFILIIYAAALLRSWLKYTALGNKWLKMNREANTDIELDIIDTGITFHDYRGATENKWDQFTRYKSFKGYFFVMKKNPGDGITFDESLISREQLDELQNFLTRYFHSQRNP